MDSPEYVDDMTRPLPEPKRCCVCARAVHTTEPIHRGPMRLCYETTNDGPVCEACGPRLFSVRDLVDILRKTLHEFDYTLARADVIAALCEAADERVDE